MNVLTKVLFVSLYHIIIIDTLLLGMPHSCQLIICKFYNLEGSREKRSLSVKAGLHDLEKLKLFKNYFYPTDEEVNKMKKGTSVFIDYTFYVNE